MVDVVARQLSGKHSHAPVEIRPGGSAVNAARALRMDDKRAVVVGCVGDDPLGRFLETALAAEGIDAALTRIEGARTGRAVTVGDATVAERGANTAFLREAIPDIRARAVLVSGYQLFRSDSGPAAAAALTTSAYSGVDVASAALISHYGAARARRLLSDVDVVVGAADALAALGSLDGPLMVTTLGSGGARAGSASAAPSTVVAGPAVGAGDAFAASLVVELAAGRSVADALERACESAARAIAAWSGESRAQ